MSIKKSARAVKKTLPIWDLRDLYPNPAAAEAAGKAAMAAARGFERRYKGRLKSLSGDAFAGAVAAYEKIDEVLARMMSYASLLHATKGDDAKAGTFYQKVSERVTDISAHLLFFTLEINRIDDKIFAGWMKTSARARRWKPFLDGVRAFRRHQLSDAIEENLHERSVTGRSAWIRLFDETVIGLRFDVGGKSLTESQTLHLLSDRDEKKRKAAAHALGRTFKDNLRLFALITNTLAKDKAVDDKQRGYARPVSYRNVANRVEDKVVEALVTSVRDAYPRLSHRYYALKSRWMGKKRLDYWNRNAPLPGDGDRTWDYHRALAFVEEAYRDFSPAMADIVARFSKGGWIDALPRAGKDSGAFAHPTVPSAHPYILVNWHGKTRDVMTLAHELGHGVHQVLAAGQGHLLSDTPLTLAETASVFGEMLTFQAILRQEKDPARRRFLLAGKVEDMLNTVVRQIGFHEFETRLHDRRKEGELTPDQISDIWMDVSRAHLGPALAFDEHYRSFWAYIPHFIHTPFYVYSYAFADCIVNALYRVYQEKPRGFADKYLELLAAGGTKRHGEILAPFGLNAGNPAFWNKGLSVIEGFIDQLEETV